MSRELIERCISKDEGAWKEFVKNFSDVVRLSIRIKFIHFRFNFNEEDIKDIAQNVFSDIWQKDKLLRVKEKDKIKSWLSIVAQNAAVDYIRRDTPLNKRISPSIDAQGQELDILDVIPSQTPDPSQAFHESELQTAVDEFLNKLPGKSRLILNLNIIYNKTHKEIAGILNISVSTISTIIRRAKEALRENLRGKGYNEY